VCARNPHELARAVECLNRITVGEVVMRASLNRKASSRFLDFKRLDYPEMDPPEWNKLVTMKTVTGGGVEVGELPLDYYRQPPYSADYEENYSEHCGL
jgi:succinate dehydrogenase/fumarate reductase flavoprotein subunit